MTAVTAEDIAEWVLGWKVNPILTEDSDGLEALDFEIVVNRPSWVEDRDDEPDSIEVTFSVGLPKVFWDTMPSNHDTIRNKIREKVYADMLRAKFGDIPVE
jgi:hypothetical protein